MNIGKFTFIFIHFHTQTLQKVNNVKRMSQKAVCCKTYRSRCGNLFIQDFDILGVAGLGDCSFLVYNFLTRQLFCKNSHRHFCMSCHFIFVFLHSIKISQHETSTQRVMTTETSNVILSILKVLNFQNYGM